MANITVVEMDEYPFVQFEGEERQDLLDSLQSHVDSNHPRTGQMVVKLYDVYEDPEDFNAMVLDRLYSLNYWGDAFSNGVVEVRDFILRSTWENEADVIVVEDLWGHRIYIFQEVTDA